MALQPKITVKQFADNCKCFYYYDSTGAYNATTNPHGYGSPNLAVSAVLKTDIVVTSSDGTQFVIDNGYLPTGTGSDAVLAAVCSGDFTNGTQSGVTTTEDCGCTGVIPTQVSGSNASIGDGCYTLEYRVYTRQPYSQTVCIYDINQALNYLIGMELWIKKNGEWVNVTADATFTSTLVTWATGDPTTDIYTTYEIRMNGNVLITGTAIQSECATSTITPSVPVVTYTYTTTVTIICNTERLLYNAALKVGLGDCSTCLVSDISLDQANTYMALCWAKYDILKEGRICGCDCVNGIIAEINNILSKTIGDCTNG